MLQYMHAYHTMSYTDVPRYTACPVAAPTVEMTAYMVHGSVTVMVTSSDDEAWQAVWLYSSDHMYWCSSDRLVHKIVWLDRRIACYSRIQCYIHTVIDTTWHSLYVQHAILHDNVCYHGMHASSTHLALLTTSMKDGAWIANSDTNSTYS